MTLERSLSLRCPQRPPLQPRRRKSPRRPNPFNLCPRVMLFRLRSLPPLAACSKAQAEGKDIEFQRVDLYPPPAPRWIGPALAPSAITGQPQQDRASVMAQSMGALTGMGSATLANGCGGKA
ncbi:MAG: hypothetical protein NTY19_03055 [Planctomycetota bacterium]|nr:hypothetical protein [Planctomycetota bacterium]